MNSFYEKLRDDSLDLHISFNPANEFVSHFHRKLELFILYEGTITLTINGNSYNLKSGDIAVMDSYDIHSYTNGKIENAVVIIVPLNSEIGFLKRKSSKKITTPIISDNEILNKIKILTNNFLSKTAPKTINESTTELILATLECSLNLKETFNVDETTLAQNLIAYIYENYKEEITLEVLSKKFGYVREHISRVFHRYFKTSLTEYVNRLRLEYIDEVINSGKKYKITDLLFTAGFKSIQTYYRAKNKLKKST